jgi:hypothetical protein
MKPYLISNEVLARQVYRYHPAYRFAAFIFLCFLLTQIPAVVWLVYERAVGEERQARATQLAADAARIATERRSLADTEKKLKRIQDLAPILRARLPISAVLGKIEQFAPPDLTVSNITIDAQGFQPIQIEAGLFRIPRQIRIAIEGEQPLQGGDVDAYNILAEQLLKSLPPESKIADRSLVGGQHFKIFRLTLIAPTNGNYYGLGVTKLATENPL